jgi:hypothetical protein
MASSDIDRIQLRSQYEQLQREYKNMETTRRVSGKSVPYSCRVGAKRVMHALRMQSVDSPAPPCPLPTTHHPLQAYAEESLAVIRKQKDLIDKMSRENDGLKGELDVEVRASQRKPFGDANLAALHDQREWRAAPQA